MKKLSARVTAIGASAATAVDELVRERRAAGADVVSFAVGEPDFPTDPLAAEAGIKAIEAGQTAYTLPAGTLSLRSAIGAHMRSSYALSYDTDEIAATSGGKYAVFAAVSALCDPGDEFLIPTPAWPSYAAIVSLAGGRAITLPCGEENGFRLTPALLDQACTGKTKALILNHPTNPTGVVYSREELLALAEVCRAHDLYLIEDIVYANIVYDGRAFIPAAAVSRDMRERTITIDGVSKRCAMTGWRIGWCCANKDIIKNIKIYVNHTTGNPSTISQAAAEKALLGDGSYARMMAQSYEERRNLFVPELDRIGLRTAMPEGAFYAMSDVRSVGFESAAEFARSLMLSENVAVVPCDGFGLEGYIRFSFSIPEERIREGLRRIERFLREGKR